MTPPIIVLFDIDGTLLSSGHAGRRSLERGFAEITGNDTAARSFAYSGMTDREIVRKALGIAGETPLTSRIDEIMERYLTILEGELQQASDFRVLPSVEETLNALEPLAHVASGLGTGNVERGARLKLGRANLWHRFDFGGYGSDSEVRSELIAKGAERGANKLGVAVSACRVVVIGDTPRDIEAAFAVGAECLAVATGRHSLEALLPHKPTLGLPNLSHADALPFILGR